MSTIARQQIQVETPAPSERQATGRRIARVAPKDKALKSGSWFAKKYAEVFQKLAE